MRYIRRQSRSATAEKPSGPQDSPAPPPPERFGFFTMFYATADASASEVGAPVMLDDGFFGLSLCAKPDFNTFMAEAPSHLRMVSDVMRLANDALRNQDDEPAKWVCALTYERLARLALRFGFERYNFTAQTPPESAEDIEYYYTATTLAQRGVPNPGYYLLVQPVNAFVERWGNGPIPSPEVWQRTAGQANTP